MYLGFVNLKKAQERLYSASRMATYVGKCERKGRRSAGALSGTAAQENFRLLSFTSRGGDCLGGLFFELFPQEPSGLSHSFSWRMRTTAENITFSVAASPTADLSVKKRLANGPGAVAVTEASAAVDFPR